MQRVEQRLEIVPVVKAEETIEEAENVKVQPVQGNLIDWDKVLVWVEQLARPELLQEERLSVAVCLKAALTACPPSPPM